MIPISTFPPPVASLSGNALTVSRFVEKPNFIARRLRELGELRYIGTDILPGRADAPTGAIGYEEVGESIFSDGTPEIVSPGAEYTLTTTGDGTAQVAKTAKWGKDTIITDEDVAARGMQVVDKGLLKLVNSAKLAIDGAVLATVSSAVTNGATATAPWTGSGAAPKILLDIMKAKAAIRGLNQGYEADAMLVDDLVWAYLAADATIQAAMAREDKSNPIYTGKFEVLAGLEIIPVPAVNLPGGVNTTSWIIDRQNLGFIATQNLGGGYLSAGDLVESKSWRTESTDGVRVRARANFKAVVTDPGAGYKINTVV